jgi:hypothetical protein
LCYFSKSVELCWYFCKSCLFVEGVYWLKSWKLFKLISEQYNFVCVCSIHSISKYFQFCLNLINFIITKLIIHAAAHSSPYGDKLLYLISHWSLLHKAFSTEMRAYFMVCGTVLSISGLNTSVLYSYLSLAPQLYNKI